MEAISLVIFLCLQAIILGFLLGATGIVVWYKIDTSSLENQVGAAVGLILMIVFFFIIIRKGIGANFVTVVGAVAV